MTSLSKKLTATLERLPAAQLSGTDLDANLFSLKLNFVFAPEEHNIIIELLNLVSFSASRTPDDEGCYNVYQVSLDLLEDGGEKALTLLGYAFKGKDDKVFSYLGRRLFHFRLEGDVCLDVVCTSYRVYEVADEPSNTSGIWEISESA